MKRLNDRIRALEERLLPTSGGYPYRTREELDAKVEQMRREGRRVCVSYTARPGELQIVEIISGPRQPGAIHIHRSYGSTGTQETT